MDDSRMDDEYSTYEKIKLVTFNYLNKKSHFTYEMGLFVSKQVG